LDHAVDSTFFRHRHRAEQRLEAIARELPHARSNDEVNRMLVAEPVKLLGLASGAVFRRSRDGSFVRQIAIGWPKTCYIDMTRGEPLVQRLGDLGTGNRVSRLETTTQGLPTGDAQPVLALPIMARRELLAFALYGGHDHGPDLAPDEVKPIGGLAIGAAVAYEYLEAKALRSEIAEMREKNRVLSRDVELLREKNT